MKRREKKGRTRKRENGEEASQVLGRLNTPQTAGQSAVTPSGTTATYVCPQGCTVPVHALPLHQELPTSSPVPEQVL